MEGNEHGLRADQEGSRGLQGRYGPLPAGDDLPPQRELRGEGSGGLHQGRDGEAGLRRGGGRRPGQRHRLDGRGRQDHRLRLPHRHRGHRQHQQLGGRSLPGLRGRRGDLRPRRLRPGGRHGRRHLRRQDHEGSGPHSRRLQDHGGGLRAGGGLRRHVLAVHRQQVLPRQGHPQGAGGVRGVHRAHRRRHLPGPPGPHGDPRGREGRLLPRLRPGAGRQRHLQDGRHPPGRARPQREPRRRDRGDQGPGEDAGSQVQPRAL